MRRLALGAAVALFSLVAGIAIAGRPETVPNDVTVDQIPRATATDADDADSE